jgi:tyrosyl-tRNA synthetase
MKFLKKFIKWASITLLTLVLLLYVFDYDYILKGVRVVYLTGHSTAFIDDFTYFENDTIKKGNQTDVWIK